VKSYWLAAHLLGFTAWLGGAFAIMAIDATSAREPRDRLGFVVRTQGAILRTLILPGAVCTTISGLMLTLSMYGQASSLGMPRPLMVMQGTGIVAAVLVLAVVAPTAARVQRLDPVGEYGPLFDALRGRLKTSGMISAALGLVALAAGAIR
jgi:regulator of extracellular matrix RemA (YlzA/DUF370 family)